MYKCQHNEKITTFCIFQNCQWKQPAGCSSCMKNHHNHFNNLKLISQDEVQSLINKFSIQSTSNKPNCRKIQQALYTYFTALKNQFATSLDNLCKTVINNIGSPFLTQNNLLNAYKRIKNKEYKRLQQKQFKKFYETVQKISPSEIIKQDSKLYKQQLKKSQKIMINLECVINSYESIFKQINEVFQHDKILFENLNIILKQSIQVHDSLSPHNEKQLSRGKIEKVQRTSIKIQTKKINDSKSLSSYYSPKLQNKQTQKLQKKTETTPTKKKQNYSQYESLTHKFGVRDFSNLQKEQTKQIEIKRPSSLDKKLTNNLTVKIPYRNQKRISDFTLIDQIQNENNIKTQRQKIKFGQKNESKLNDTLAQTSTKKSSQISTPTPFDKRQSSLKQSQISQRKEQLMEMMKNFSFVNKINQKQKINHEKHHQFQKYNHSHTHQPKISQINQSKVLNNNSLMVKPSSYDISPQLSHRKNPSLLVQDKRHYQLQKYQRKKEEEKKYQLIPSNSAKIDTLKSPLLQKSQISSIPHIPQDLQKSQNGSVQDVKKLLPKKNMYAHPKLPIQQIQQRPKQLACSRLIIVPTIQKFKDVKSDQIDSPLLKKKATYSIKNDKSSKKQSNSPLKQEQFSLKQNQQKSLNLLIKSIHLKPQQAINTLQTALKQAPNNLSAAEYLSFLYLQNSKPRQALTVCNLILDRFEIITKQNQELLINLQNNKSAALNMLGRYSEAIVLLERIIKFKQKDLLFKNLGDAYYFSSNYQKAITYYEKTVKLSPFYDQAYYNMAVCYYLLNNFYSAKQSIYKALQTAPKNAQYIQLKKHIEEKLNSA